MTEETTQTSQANAEPAESLANLDTLLKDEPEKKEPVEPVEKPAAKEPEKKDVKDDKKDPAATSAAEEGGHVPVKAVQEERRKRQAAEAELAEYKSKEKKEPEKKAERPNALEDPEGAVKHTESEFDKRLIDERIRTSDNIMLVSKQAFPDYTEKKKVFIELAKADPQLVVGMRQSDNPAMYVYEKAKEHLDYQEFLTTKETPEYKEFLEAKKAGKLPESEQAKRNKSALDVPDVINATQAEKRVTAVKLDTLGDLLTK